MSEVMVDSQAKEPLEHKKEVVKEEEEVYRTWPDRSKLSPARQCGEVTGSVSVQHLPTTTSTISTISTSTKTSTQPMSMAAALEGLNISYSPGGKCLQASRASPEVESDENERQNIYYKPGHRKAYSLPRTLEGVDDNGTISHPVVEHDVVVESPRTAIQRCGLQYQDWRHPGPNTDPDCDSSVSEAGDSGVFSESQTSQAELSVRPRLGQMIRSGLAANLRLLSRSGQQVAARLARREAETESVSPASSQSLIMEGRPAGLPGKSQAEEEKHRAEHSQILLKIKRREMTEGRSRAQRLHHQRRTEDDLSQLTSHWATTVLPAWSREAGTKATRALWWRGLPPPVRGRVWRLALPNTLNLTASLYQILVRRARDQLDSPGQVQGDSREETLDLIRLDVSRTFPQLCIFQAGGPYFQLLHNVLGAYVCYRPDIGYVQGMSFIAAILILNMDEADAFITFANLLNWPQLAAFFCMSEAKVRLFDL